MYKLADSKPASQEPLSIHDEANRAIMYIPCKAKMVSI